MKAGSTASDRVLGRRESEADSRQSRSEKPADSCWTLACGRSTLDDPGGFARTLKRAGDPILSAGEHGGGELSVPRPGQIRGLRPVLCLSIVPDSFPTIEVAAALGLLVLILRAVLLDRMVGEIKRVNDRLVQHLDAGERERALALCDALETAVYPQIARRVLGAAERCAVGCSDEELEATLRRAFATSYTAQAHRVQSAVARDLIVLGVLAGTIAYTYASGLGVSIWFYVVSGMGGLIILYGAVSRRRLLSAVTRAAQSLLPASARAARLPYPHGSVPERCPLCGAPRSSPVASVAGLCEPGQDAASSGQASKGVDEE